MTTATTAAATVAELLGLGAGSDPDAPALLAAAPATTVWTRAQLLDACRGLGGALTAVGVRHGDRVAVVLPNGPEAAIAFLGIASVAASAPLDPSAPATELTRRLGEIGARAVVTVAGSPAFAAAAAHGCPVVTPNGAAVHAGPLSVVAANDVALILPTSGTTARPKLVPLTHANLLASAANITRTLGLGPGDRCLNVMPLFHVHGLVAALLASLWSGGSVVCTPGFQPADVPGWIDAHEITWLTAVPTLHQALLERLRRDPAAAPRRRLRFVRSSSAPLAPVVARGLEEALGTPVIEAYGMTEGAHQLASNPLPPRHRRPGSVGPPAGPEVTVLDDAGRTVPAGAAGEVAVRGANVTAGYLDSPGANEATFTADGWLRTGDLGRFDDDGYLWLTGRAKELINRGGEKVSPREVDEVLLAHPDVVQAVTFAVPDRRLGEQVAAAVVLRPGARAGERDLRELVALRLAPHKVPRRIVLLDAVPLGPTGKPQRVGLAARLGLADLDGVPVRGDGEPAAPANPIEELVAGLWHEVLGTAPDGVHDHFLECGGDSLAATRLLARLRDDLDLEVSLLDFFDAPTVAEQAALVEQALRRANRHE